MEVSAPQKADLYREVRIFIADLHCIWGSIAGMVAHTQSESIPHTQICYVVIVYNQTLHFLL